MKYLRFAALIFAIVLLSVCFVFTASAQTEKDALYFVANSENENTKIYPQVAVDKNTYMFLPSSADLGEITLYSDTGYDKFTVSADNNAEVAFGESFDLPALFSDSEETDGEYKVKITVSDGEEIVFEKTLIIMKSENIRSLFITSENPAEKGRKWIDSSKSNKAKGNIVYIDTQGNIVNADEMTEIKARGNSTFTDFEKKAYQFKIKNKFNMTGDESNAQKKWVLLANAGDVTLIHNSLVVTLAKDLGIPYTVDAESIDLYYDGEYRGSYLLTDKVEVGKTGVDIQDLDGLIEELNEDSDAYENPVVVTKTFASKGEVDAKVDSKGSYKYVDGLAEPELEEGTSHHAYLIELDFIYRYPDEQSGFVTNRGQAVVTKNPEYLTKETGAFISQFYQDFEDAVFSPDGYNEKTGKYYYEYCDLDSLVKIYLINEYTKNYDSYRSSTYFYLPEDEDIMYAGPTWDYDLSFTTGYDYNSQIAGNPENFWAATKYLASTLITIESFRDAVKEYLNSEAGEFYLAAEKMLGEDGNIMSYAQSVYASQKMNYKLWTMTAKTKAYRCGDAETYENAVDFLLDFATERLAWLSETTDSWEGDSYYAPMDPAKWSSTYRYHTPKKIEAKEATCTEAGRTEGSLCSACGLVLQKSTVIPAKGHSWVPETCDTPVKCSVCGVTDGKGFGHKWTEATCQNPKTCTVCEKTEGELADHLWSEASCMAPATCSVCGETKGDLADHKWSDATCQNPKTCTVCKKTEGSVTSHSYVKDTEDSRNSETCAVHKCIYCGRKLLVSVPAKPRYQPGDMNMDGEITAADARIALRISAELESADSEKITIGDINGDKQITAADARLILRKSAMLDI